MDPGQYDFVSGMLNTCHEDSKRGRVHNGVASVLEGGTKIASKEAHSTKHEMSHEGFPDYPFQIHGHTVVLFITKICRLRSCEPKGPEKLSHAQAVQNT